MPEVKAIIGKRAAVNVPKNIYLNTRNQLSINLYIKLIEIFLLILVFVRKHGCRYADNIYMLNIMVKVQNIRNYI